jgi:hypothetical protein
MLAVTDKEGENRVIEMGENVKSEKKHETSRENQQGGEKVVIAAITPAIPGCSSMLPSMHF